MQITVTEVEDKSMYARSSEAAGLYKKPVAYRRALKKC